MFVGHPQNKTSSLLKEPARKKQFKRLFYYRVGVEGKLSVEVSMENIVCVRTINSIDRKCATIIIGSTKYGALSRNYTRGTCCNRRDKRKPGRRK